MWVPQPELARAEFLTPPPWASAWGDDAHGLFADWAWGDVTQRMRWIPPGTFLMGSMPAESNALARHLHETTGAESPQHQVRLTSGYWLANTPCTQGLWGMVMGDMPARFSKAKDWTSRPVEKVSWNRVQGFLAALQKRLPAGWEVGLPTEAQWEYAARAGTRTAYWWGNKPDSSRANWGEEQKGTTPVDRYEPNPWGLYDMHGNVWEWCQGAGRKYDKRPQLDPADAKHKEHRALRGGAWDDDAGRARAASRHEDHPGFVWLDYGFRILLGSVSVPSSAAGPRGPGTLA